MKKFTKVVAVIFTLALGTTSLAGCSQADDEKSKAQPSTASVSVESSTEEVSVESSAESSADKSSAEGSVESKVDESSSESSVESKVDESSVESSVESKVDESSVESSVESKVDESSAESSVESKIDESSEKDDSSTSSNKSFNPTKVVLNGIYEKASEEDVTCSGKFVKDVSVFLLSENSAPLYFCIGDPVQIIKIEGDTCYVYLESISFPIDASCIEVLP